MVVVGSRRSRRRWRRRRVVAVVVMMVVVVGCMGCHKRHTLCIQYGILTRPMCLLELLVSGEMIEG
ncbi:hypothetical protein Hanom_Chr12g01133541 [Helianthus anomalus]